MGSTGHETSTIDDTAVAPASASTEIARSLFLADSTEDTF
jgi:hypothetical protein